MIDFATEYKKKNERNKNEKEKKKGKKGIQKHGCENLAISLGLNEMKRFMLTMRIQQLKTIPLRRQMSQKKMSIRF